MQTNKKGASGKAGKTPNLKRVIELTWSGEVTYKEAVKGFTKSQIECMESYIKFYPHLHIHGVYFLEELFKGIHGNIPELETDGAEVLNGMLYLQALVNNID